MDLTAIRYEAPVGYSLDGVSHYSSWSSGAAPRDYLLYNDYYNVDGSDFSLWDNQSFAIRNHRYKLIHAYNGTYSDWFGYDETLADDDEMADECCMECFVFRAMADGDYFYGLYDLQDDPYETVNLYDSMDDDISSVKAELYAVLLQLENNSAVDVSGMESTSLIAPEIWKNASDYIVPYVSGDHVYSTRSYPDYCGSSSSIVVDDDNPTMLPTHWPTASPDSTESPTHWPTKTPTNNPTNDPTEWPTHWPTKTPTNSPVDEVSAVQKRQSIKGPKDTVKAGYRVRL